MQITPQPIYDNRKLPSPVAFEGHEPVELETKGAHNRAWEQRHETRTEVHLDKALRARLRSMAHRTDDNHVDPEDWYGFCEFHLDNFMDYGLGLFLYFSTLKRFAQFFLVCSLLYVPAMVYNGWSEPSHTGITTTYQIERLFLGNLGLDNDAIILGLDKKEIGLMQSVLDLAIIIASIGFILWLHIDKMKEIKQYDSKATVNHFAVEVIGLPVNLRNTLDDRQALAAHFSGLFGPAVDVTIAGNDMDLIQLYTQRGHVGVDLRAKKQAGKKGGRAGKRLCAVD